MERTKLGRFFLKSNFVKNYWIPYQHILFGPVICYLVLLYWTVYLHPRHSLRSGNYQELALYGVFYWTFWGPYFSWWALFSHWSVYTNLVMFFGLAQVSAPYIFINFSVSHTHLGLVEPDDQLTWVEYSSRFTMNCDNHWFTNWWMSYLNFQIEHHLFPQCPQYRFAKISPRVKAFLESHGEPYQTLPYFKALEKTFLHLKHTGEEVEKMVSTVEKAKKAGENVAQQIAKKIS